MTAPDLDLQPICWKDIEEAIYDWVVLFTGCAAIWADQNLPQPAYPYVDLKRTSVTPLGGRPEIRDTTDLTKPNGQEIELLATRPVEFVLTTQVHIDEEAGANNPDIDAFKIATRLQASLGLISVQETLAAAGLSIVEELLVIDTSLVVNGRFVNRAVMDVRLRTASVMTERVGYIEKVEVEAPDLGFGPVILDAGA